MSDVKAVDVITGEVNVVDEISGEVNVVDEVSGELGTPYPARGLKGDPGTTDYNELENKPTIPTKVSELTNDSGYQTQSGTTANIIPKNTSGSLDYASLPLAPYGKGDKFAFIPAENIVIEETTDGGTTWTIQAHTDDEKCKLFDSRQGGTGITIPNLNGTQNALCGVRVTISAVYFKIPAGVTDAERVSYWTSSNYYCLERYGRIQCLCIWATYSGGSFITMTAEQAKLGDAVTWTKIGFEGSLAGWSGANWITYPSGGSWTFGTYLTAGNPFALRLTFFTAKTSSVTRTKRIYAISAFGPNIWTVPNARAGFGELYTWDHKQNVTFPALLYAEGAQVYAEKPFKLIETIKMDEDAIIDRSATPDGVPYAFREMYVLFSRGDDNTIAAGAAMFYSLSKLIGNIYLSSLYDKYKYYAMRCYNRNGYWFGEHYTVSDTRANYAGISPSGEAILFQNTVSANPSITRLKISTLTAGTTVTIWAVDA